MIAYIMRKLIIDTCYYVFINQLKRIKIQGKRMRMIIVLLIVLILVITIIVIAVS